MSKKSIEQYEPLATTRKLQGRISAGIIGFSSLLTSTIAGLWRKLRRMLMSESGITKEDSTELPGPAYVFGSSPTAAADIAALYDKGEYPNFYDSSGNDNDKSLNNRPWPIWTDDATHTASNNPLVDSHLKGESRPTQGTLDDYWIEHKSDMPDLDSNGDE